MWNKSFQCWGDRDAERYYRQIDQADHADKAFIRTSCSSNDGILNGWNSTPSGVDSYDSRYRLLILIADFKDFDVLAA
jgi:hypothetical protein